jgi:hypothetical protein
MSKNKSVRNAPESRQPVSKSEAKRKAAQTSDLGTISDAIMGNEPPAALEGVEPADLVAPAASGPVMGGPGNAGNAVVAPVSTEPREVTLTKRITEKGGLTSYTMPGVRASVYFSKGMFKDGVPPESFTLVGVGLALPGAGGKTSSVPSATLTARAEKALAKAAKAEAQARKAQERADKLKARLVPKGTNLKPATPATGDEGPFSE